MRTETDVLIVGAGPGGAAAAYYLAKEGFNVVALEKSFYPREKVCGDGLTPRAVKELQLIDLPHPEDEGWIRNKGLRMVGGGHKLEFPWHELEYFPHYGLSMPRANFDYLLAQHARSAGADVREGWFVERALTDKSGRVIGVVAKQTDEKGRKAAEEVEFYAPIVIAADGVSARIALGQGLERKTNRPIGVAVRTYYETERHDDEWMEGHLEVWDGEPGKSKLLPGYGWIFPLGDGTANVGLGTLSAKGTPPKLDHRALMQNFVQESSADWGFTPEGQRGKVLGAAIPMAFNRQPHYVPGMLLVGDSGGMVNPFNGEGIAYAMQAARIATECLVKWREASDDRAKEAALESYIPAMKAELGGYFRLGQIFSRVISHSAVMKVCTKYGLPNQTIMKFTHKLLADLYEPKGGDWADKLMRGLTRIVPKA